MEHVDVVLHNSIPCLDIKRMSLGLSIPTCEPESPASSDDWHLPHGGEHRIPPQQAECAAIVLPFRECQPRLVLGRRSVNSLGLSDRFGSRLWARCQWVVGHHEESEKRGGIVGHLGLGHFDRGGLWATDNVVEVEVKVAELLLLEAQRCWGYALVETRGFCGGE
ncbi:hypothetical protein CR513_55649, partial [Mucuna pruriens]